MIKIKFAKTTKDEITDKLTIFMFTAQNDNMHTNIIEFKCLEYIDTTQI